MPEPSDTATRLILAAERLIGEDGDAATSLRAIARAAHANAAAIHYHFGGRDNLMRAVLDRYAEPLRERRRRTLDELRLRHAADVPPAELVEALIRTDIEALADLRRDNPALARMLVRSGALFDGPLVARAARALRRAVPRVAEAELVVRLHLVQATVAAAIAQDGLTDDSVDAQVGQLTAFCTAGVCAPAATAASKRKRRKRERAG